MFHARVCSCAESWFLPGCFSEQICKERPGGPQTRGIRAAMTLMSATSGQSHALEVRQNQLLST